MELPADSLSIGRGSVSNCYPHGRVLVDPGNAADLLQLPAFKQMKLSLGVVNSA